MHPIIQKFISSFESIKRTRNLYQQYHTIDLLGVAGQTDMLYELGIALETNTQWLPQELWAVEATFDHLERVLSLTPGLAYADMLIKLSCFPRTQSKKASGLTQERTCHLASLLASAQNFRVLATMIDKYKHTEGGQEFLCALLQEMVIRDMPCEEAPAIVEFHEQIKKSGHPLGWLPLRLHAIESLLPLPAYTTLNACFQLPCAILPAEKFLIEQVKERKKRAFKEEIEQREHSNISSAVEGWSNGSWEAKVFNSEKLLGAEQIVHTLMHTAALSCLQGATEKEIVLSTISPNDVFRLLFVAAAHGGAYDQGKYGAYGRLAVWHSLAGLTGGADNSLPDNIESDAQESQWFYFQAPTKWFYQLPWDIGLIALRPEGRALGILAATSTN